MFKTNFSEHNKIWGTKMFEGNCPRMYPMSAGLGRTVAEKSSIVGLRVCAVGLDILKCIFNSQNNQNFQIVQIPQ